MSQDDRTPQIEESSSPVAVRKEVEDAAASEIARDAGKWLLGGALALGTFAIVATRPLADAISSNDYAAVLVYACFGWIPLPLLAAIAWLVFGRQRFLVRLAGCWLVMASLLLLWLAGSYLDDWFSFRDEFPRLLFGLPVVALGLQLPLWPLRLYARWRIEQHGAAVDEPPLSIRDIMLGTASVAVTLASIRLAGTGTESRDLPIWAAILGGMAAFTLVSLVPCGIAILRTDSLRSGCIFALMYALAFYAIAIAAAHWFGVVNNHREGLGFTTSFVALAGTLISALVGLRLLGYRLRIGR